ncbi:unnamed protein product [Cylicocyclus nassatus]|uniref:Uncharacterized protein n=1 Tax=Cylicocyclus nassatus TaxID=53992 RepID=A0AA36GMC0_CYLNA|nr:unnamed protein product [Cylicocyclus nassatus]
MESKCILNILFLGWFSAVWFCTRLVDVSVPVSSVPSHRIRSAIASTVFHCPFTLTLEKQRNDGPKEKIMIEGGRGTMFLYREKIAAIFSHVRDANLVIQWFIGQIRLDHILVDVLSFEFVWLALLCSSVVSVFTQLFIFEPFLKVKHAPAGYLREAQSGEAAYINTLLRRFVIEKLLMLAYVIVRNPQVNDKLTFSSRRVSIFDWSHRVTDASVFAIWFIVVWSVTSVTTAANQRFELIIGINLKEDNAENEKKKQAKSKKKPNKEKHTKDSTFTEEESEHGLLMKRLLLLLTACLFTSTALISFGFTSFKVMHPMYSMMIVVEAISVLVRSIYVGYRIGWWQMVPDASVRETEAFQRRVYMSKRITDIVLNSLATLLYTLYLVTGTVINGKLIALVFVARLSHHLHRTVCNISDHFKGLGTSKFLD